MFVYDIHRKKHTNMIMRKAYFSDIFFWLKKWILPVVRPPRGTLLGIITSFGCAFLHSTFINQWDWNNCQISKKNKQKINNEIKWANFTNHFIIDFMKMYFTNFVDNIFTFECDKTESLIFSRIKKTSISI